MNIKKSLRKLLVVIFIVFFCIGFGDVPKVVKASSYLLWTGGGGGDDTSLCEYKYEYAEFCYTDSTKQTPVSVRWYRDDASIKTQTLYEYSSDVTEILSSWDEEGNWTSIVIGNYTDLDHSEYLGGESWSTQTYNTFNYRYLYHFKYSGDTEWRESKEETCLDEDEVTNCTDGTCAVYEYLDSDYDYCQPSFMTCPLCEIPDPPEELTITPSSANKNLWKNWE